MTQGRKGRQLMYQRPNHTWLPLLFLLFLIPFIFAVVAASLV